MVDFADSDFGGASFGGGFSDPSVTGEQRTRDNYGRWGNYWGGPMEDNPNTVVVEAIISAMDRHGRGRHGAQISGALPSQKQENYAPITDPGIKAAISALNKSLNVGAAKAEDSMMFARDISPFYASSASAPPLDLSTVDIDPWANYTGPTFDHTNSIKDMQDLGHGKLSFLAGMIPGARQITSLLNNINLHDIGPYMTEEEFNWDDARWEGGASDGDLIRRLFTPQQSNPNTTDALAYGNAYNMWEGGDHDN